LGLGYYGTDKDETYFKVIVIFLISNSKEWKSGTNFRKSIGLDVQYFYITVGFKNQGSPLLSDMKIFMVLKKHQKLC
jgi:hypothetical protein